MESVWFHWLCVSEVYPSWKPSYFIWLKSQNTWKSGEYWCDFQPAALNILMPAALNISQSQASHFIFFFLKRLFYLVQTSIKVSPWPLHLHCVTLSNLGKKSLAWVLLLCAQGPPKTQGLLSASLLSALLPLDGTKAQGKVLGCKVGLGWGGRASLQGARILPPWPGTSSILPAPEDTRERSEGLSIRFMAE